jgi:hypothetical protein
MKQERSMSDQNSSNISTQKRKKHPERSIMSGNSSNPQENIQKDQSACKEQFKSTRKDPERSICL